MRGAMCVCWLRGFDTCAELCVYVGYGALTLSTPSVGYVDGSLDGTHQPSYPTSGPVCTGMGDCIWVQFPVSDIYLDM